MARIRQDARDGQHSELSHARPNDIRTRLPAPTRIGSGDWLDRSIVAALFVQENGCYAGLPGVDFRARAGAAPLKQDSVETLKNAIKYLEKKI